MWYVHRTTTRTEIINRIYIMERKNHGEEVHRISISRLKKTFAEESYSSDNIIMSPLITFRSLDSAPRTIDGITIGIICNGKAKITINGRNHELRTNSLVMLREDSVVSALKCSKACRGYLMTYSRNFLDMINIATSDFLSVYMVFSTTPCIRLTDTEAAHLHRVGALLADVVRTSGKSAYDNRIITSIFSAFFYSLVAVLNTKLPSEPKIENQSRTDALMAEFIRILGTDCERERSVEYYASKLGISPKYLSLICKKKTGKNASKIIDDVVIHRAKDLLLQTGLSIQEVADRLNFVSQSFFGKYFKQRVGISPSRYKTHE